MNSTQPPIRAFVPGDIACVLGVIACSLIGFAHAVKFLSASRSILLAIAIALCIALAMLWLRWRHLKAHRKIGPWWLVLPWCVFTLLFIFLYPLAQKHVFGPGSDRADALSLAASALLHGHYPYRATTFLGNAITPLPGAILLAIPFFILGSVALQNLFWLGMLLWLTRLFFSSKSTGIIFVLVLLGASAANLDDFVVGGDYIVNAMYVCIALAVAMAAHKKNYAVWLQIVSEVFLGVAVDSRPIYLVVLPLFFAYLLQRRSRQIAVRAFSIATGIAILLPLSLYLYDPGSFTPLHVRHELDFLSQKLYPSVILGLIGILASCAGFFIRISRRRVYLFTGIALFLIVGVPGVLGWFVLPQPIDSWFEMSLATPSALFLSLWIFETYEKTGSTLRAENKAALTKKSADPTLPSPSIASS